MKCNREYYQAVLKIEDVAHNIYRTYEANDFELCKSMFEAMELSLKKKPRKEKWTLLLEKHCSPMHVQVLKIRSSDSKENVDSPLY